MIKSLHIRNFLSHKKSDLVFSPGVNIIVGLTDSGKSAIIKAFKWLIFNRPNGGSFRSHWGGTTSVSVVVDGVKVHRSKTDRVNEYGISKTKSTKASLFKAFKTGVPIEISNVLKLDEVNLQSQFDSHFLLSSSSGEVAKHFNHVAHLEKITIGQSNIKKWQRELDSSVKADKDEISRLEGTLSEYSDIYSIEAKIIKLERINRCIDKLNTDKNALSECVEEAQRIEDEIKQESTLLPAGDIVDRLLGYYKTEKGIDSQLDSLQYEYSELVTIEADIKESELLTSAESLVDTLIDIDNKLRLNDGVLQELEAEHNYACLFIDKGKELIKELKELEEKFDTNMGDTCKFCGFNKILNKIVK